MNNLSLPTAWLMLILLTACEGVSPPSTSQTHSVTLSWTTPVQRSDNTTLTPQEIDGYSIRYGQTSNNLNNSIEVTNGAATNYTINDLTSGTWYFNIQTLDTNGQTSSVTTEISVTL